MSGPSSAINTLAQVGQNVSIIAFGDFNGHLGVNLGSLDNISYFGYHVSQKIIEPMSFHKIRKNIERSKEETRYGIEFATKKTHKGSS